MLTPVINPDSAVPPYEQVAKMLRDEIAQGTMTGRIPSVHTIAEHHHVSHRVVARALEILQGEGMIENVPGEGHVVRDLVPAAPHTRSSSAACPCHASHNCVGVAR
jgi:DNA-binding transcriptional regulator YhcF (GntR family)